MRRLIVALGFTLTLLSAALPARAQTIGPAEVKAAQVKATEVKATEVKAVDVKAHIGQTVTVEAAVSDVHTGRSGVTFIDFGGRYPDSNFTAVIFADDAAKFPNTSALDGKTVAISGPVSLYQGRPEIILKTADQLKTK